MPTITIKIASCGTLMSDGTSSMAGHMWFDLDDGLGHSNSSTSYGWAPVVEVAVIWNKENRNPCIQTFADTAEEVWKGMQGKMAAGGGLPKRKRKE